MTRRVMPKDKTNFFRPLFAAGLLCALSLAACNTTQPPAPAFHYGQQGGADSAGFHTAAGGDTLWSVAQRYRLSMQDIIRVNSLQPPYTLTDGQRLRLPAPAEYKARPGDTVYGIARTFNVSPAQLAHLNAMTSPYAIIPGQIVRLPATPTRVVAPPYQPAMPVSQPEYQIRTAAATPAAVMASPVPPYESGMPPSSSPSGLVVEPVTASPLPAPVSSAVLPPAGVPSSEISSSGASSAAIPSAVPVWAPPPVAPPALPPALAPDMTPMHAAGLPPRASDKFVWPVSGPVVSSYGPRQGGLHNDGINIKAPKGAPVRAADNGVVAYAGSELKGFGNLVLIRHADRWMTAYAHMDRVLVKSGQKVRQGESIGAVGDSGSVDSPQLHFEVRRGSEALNPVPYLKRQGT